MVITVPGTYTLGGDIQDDEHIIVVEIRCSNVVIEGNGHRITGNGQDGRCGIYASNAAGALTGIVVRNLTVSNCYYGIYLVNTDAGRIERCQVDAIPSNGMGLILAQGSDGNTITEGGPYLGGNFWARPDGSGWSEQVADADHDGIGDSPYVLVDGNSDLLP